MKKLLFLFVFLTSIIMHSQELDEIINNPFEAYYKSLNWDTSNNSVSDKSQLTYNEKTANAIFARLIGGQYNNTYDISFKPIQFNFEPKDKKFFLGTAFSIGDLGFKSLKHTVNAGLKGTLDESFSTAFSTTQPKSNLGPNFKYTFTLQRKLNVDQTKIPFLKELRKKDLDLMKRESNLTKSEALAMYEEIAEGNAEDILNHGFLTNAWGLWISIDSYFPVIKKNYKIINPETSEISNTANFRATELNLIGNFFYTNSKNHSFYATPIVGVKNNNNIEISKLDKFQLQRFHPDNTNLLIETKEYFKDDYQTFTSYTAKIELVYFFIYKGRVGLSGEIVRRFDDYGTTNWKIGLPVNLKIDDKERFNFEFAYKEVDGEKYAGINVSLLFGEYIQ